MCRLNLFHRPLHKKFKWIRCRHLSRQRRRMNQAKLLHLIKLMKATLSSKSRPIKTTHTRSRTRRLRARISLVSHQDSLSKSLQDCSTSRNKTLWRNNLRWLPSPKLRLFKSLSRWRKRGKFSKMYLRSRPVRTRWKKKKRGTSTTRVKEASATLTLKILSQVIVKSSTMSRRAPSTRYPRRRAMLMNTSSRQTKATSRCLKSRSQSLSSRSPMTQKTSMRTSIWYSHPSTTPKRSQQSRSLSRRFLGTTERCNVSTSQARRKSPSLTA